MSIWIGGKAREIEPRSARGRKLPQRPSRNTAAHQPSLLLRDSGELLHPTGRIHVFGKRDLSPQQVDVLLRRIDKLTGFVRRRSGKRALTLGVSRPDQRFDLLDTLEQLSQFPRIERVEPELRLPLRRAAALYPWQWDLHGRVETFRPSLDHPGIRLSGAHGLSRGRREVVIAVIDDGFDLAHPCFRDVAISELALDAETGLTGLEHVIPDNVAYHGTPTAGVAVAGPHSETQGIAPECTLLPIRMDLHGNNGAVSPEPLTRAIEHASQHADVVVCAFNNLPSTVKLVSPALVTLLDEVARTGGRRKNGLIVVFPTGNSGLPIDLDSTANVDGVVFYDTLLQTLVTLPPGSSLRGNFCALPGVFGVGGVTSELRRAAFSSFGRGLDLVAPTNNGHAISWYGATTTAAGSNYHRRYPGAQPIAPANRPGIGKAVGRIPANTFQTGSCESLYCLWGGTSHCAPLVAGVAALMVSVNPQLSAHQILTILRETAHRDSLSPGAYVPTDQNLNGATPHFNNGWSQWFGHGLLDAERAVWRAREMVPPATTGPRECC